MIYCNWKRGLLRKEAKAYVWLKLSFDNKVVSAYVLSGLRTHSQETCSLIEREECWSLKIMYTIQIAVPNDNLSRATEGIACCISTDQTHSVS